MILALIFGPLVLPVSTSLVLDTGRLPLPSLPTSSPVPRIGVRAPAPNAF